MTNARPGHWLDRFFPISKRNRKSRSAGLSRLQFNTRPWLEALEDRTLLATNITVIVGSAGAGILDSLLDATHGTITAADDPGDTAATLSTGALTGVGAGVAISVAADATINFDDLTSLNLPNQSGVDAAFSTATGAISFANVANIVSTSGGSLTFSAGADLTIANLNTNGGNVSLTAGVSGTGGIQVGSGASVQSNGGDITLGADTMTIAGSINAAAGIVTLAPETSGRNIDLGTNPSAGSLGLAQSDLDQVTASVLRIGDVVNSGDITITAAITGGAGWDTLDLRSGGSINETGGSITVTNLALQAAAEVNVYDTITPNDVAVLAGRVANASAMFQYIDANAYTVGSVDGIDGIATNNGPVFLAILGSATLTVSDTAAAADVASSGGLIEFTVDGVDLQAGSVIDAGDGGVVVRNNDISLPFDLGGSGGPGVLGLTAAELNTIVTTGTFRIGEINAGDITVSAPVAPLHVGAFELDTGAGITEDAGATITAPDLVISAAAAVTLNAANDITAGSLSATVTNGSQGFTFAAANSLTVSGITTVDGAVTVESAGGGLTVNGDVVAGAGDITLTASEGSSATADDLMLNSSIIGGNVTLQAGDAVRVSSSSSVQAGGAVTIDVGFGDNDSDGGTLDLQGQVTGATLAAYGSSAGDTFTVHTSFSSLLTIYGQGGADIYNLTPSTTTPINIVSGFPGPVRGAVNIDFGGLAVHLAPRIFTAANNQPITLGTTGNIATINLNNAASINTFYGPDTANRGTLSGLTAQERFVGVLYLNALGRIGAHNELDVWVNFMNSPGGSQALVARGIETSPEARGHLVRIWYQTFLGRAAAGGEERGWANLLLQGAREESVLSDILGTPEFFNHAQTLTSTGSAQERYVQALYMLLLNRTASGTEITAWVSAISVLGRDGVAFDFLSSPEFRVDLVEAHYETLLHRPSDHAGLNGWLSSALDALNIRLAFESSSEFFAKG
jgi:hypothetical protein